MATNVGLEIGSTFNTYAELKRAVEQFEKVSFVQLYIRSSRGIDVQRRRAPQKNFKDGLMYGELNYACIHGGRRFKSRSTGQRPNQSTIQMECPFLIRVRVTQDGQQLFVKELCGEHNHAVTDDMDITHFETDGLATKHQNVKRIKFNEERDFALLNEALAERVFDTVQGIGWKRVAFNLIRTTSLFPPRLTPRAVRERTNYILDAYMQQRSKNLANGGSALVEQPTEKDLLLEELMEMREASKARERDRTEAGISERDFGIRVRQQMPRSPAVKVKNETATASADDGDMEDSTEDAWPVSMSTSNRTTAALQLLPSTSYTGTSEVNHSVVHVSQSVNHSNPSNMSSSTNKYVSALRAKLSQKRNAAPALDDELTEDASCRRKIRKKMSVEDEFDAFGRTIALRLRNLPVMQQIHAKKSISDVLFEAELEHFSKESNRNLAPVVNSTILESDNSNTSDDYESSEQHPTDSNLSKW